MSSMTLAQQIITIGMCILGTMATRYLPFFIFKENKKTPEYIQYLGKFLPSAVFGMLVIYCLKNVELLHGTHGIPEGISILVTAVLHMWKKNMFLSIAGGTICYMLILYFLFPVLYCTASRFLPYRTMSSILLHVLAYGTPGSDTPCPLPFRNMQKHRLSHGSRRHSTPT